MKIASSLISLDPISQTNTIEAIQTSFAEIEKSFKDRLKNPPTTLVDDFIRAFTQEFDKHKSNGSSKSAFIQRCGVYEYTSSGYQPANGPSNVPSNSADTVVNWILDECTMLTNLPQTAAVNSPTFLSQWRNEFDSLKTLFTF